MFKSIKLKLKINRIKRLKSLDPDRGGKYYGRYDGPGRCPEPLANFLKEYGIVAQYTISGTPRQNGVTER